MKSLSSNDNKEPSSPCTDVLEHVVSYFLTENDTLLHIIRNSGHDYNDFGRFHDCKHVHNMNYYLVSILDKFPVPMAVGLCLPQECSLSDVESFKPTLLNGIESVMPNMLEQVKGFDSLNITLTLDDLRIVDSHSENQQVVRFTKGSLFFCIVFSSFLLSVLIGTCIVWKKRQDEF